MPITYKLTPTQLDCAPQIDDKSDVVLKVHWAYTATNGSKSAGLGGTTELVYDPDQHDFTPYSALTSEQVADWVVSSWTPEQLASNKAILDGQLGVASPPLPWVESAPAEELSPPIPEPENIPLPVIEEDTPPINNDEDLLL